MEKSEQASIKNVGETPTKAVVGWPRWLLGATGLGLAITVGGSIYWATSNRRPSEPSPNKGLSVQEQYLNFGEVWEDEAFRWPIKIENHNGHDVEIVEYSRSCSCSTVEPQSMSIPAGGTGELTLTIDLLPRRAPAKESASREFELILKPTLAGESLNIDVWKIRGRVKKALRFERSFYLGSHSELAQPLPSWTVSIQVFAPLESLTAQSDVPGLDATAEFTRNSKAATLRLTPKAKLDVGELEGTIRLRPKLVGGKPLPERGLSVSGKIIVDIEPEPSLVQVGGRRLGEQFEEVVTLRSLTGRPLAPLRVNAEGEGLVIKPLQEAAGRYLVRQKVVREGIQTNRVHFHTESGGRDVVIRVPVTYTGHAAQ